MNVVLFYELFDGMAPKNHAFSVLSFLPTTASTATEKQVLLKEINYSNNESGH